MNVHTLTPILILISILVLIQPFTAYRSDALSTDATTSPPLPIDSPLNNNMSDRGTSRATSPSQDELIEGIKKFDLNDLQGQQDALAQLMALINQNKGSTDTGWRKVAAAQAQADSLSQHTDKDLLLAFCRSLGITFKTLGISKDTRPFEIAGWIETLDEIDKGGKVDIEKWRTELISKQQYFLTIEEVVKAEPEPYTPETPENFFPDFEANLFKRGRAPNGVDGYNEMTKMKQEGNYDNKTLAASRQDSTTGEVKDATLPCDIIGRNLETADGAQVAHLIPDCNNADEWADIACWAFGLDPKETTCGVALRLLHGVSKTIKDKDSKPKQQRIHGTGLRFSKANKLRIDHQSTLFDNDNPSLLIIPIRTVEQCKKWNGEAYEAIVLLKKDKLESLGLTGTVATNVHDANYRDVTDAINLLRQCTIVMVKSLNDTSSLFPTGDPFGKVEKSREDAFRTRLGDRRTSFVEACGEEGKKSVVLPMPVEKGDLDLRYKGVCKIKFSDCRDDPVATKNPAPDPLLLVARASVVWSVMHGIHLRTAAEPRPDDESDASDDSGALMLLPSDYPLPSPLKEQRDSVPEIITVGTEDDSLVSALEPNFDNHDDDISSISSLSFTG